MATRGWRWGPHSRVAAPDASCSEHARTPRLCAQALQESNGSLDAAIDAILALPPPEDVPDASLFAPSTGGQVFAEPPCAALPRVDSRQLPSLREPEAVVAGAGEAGADDDEEMAQLLRFAGHKTVGRSVPGA